MLLLPWAGRMKSAVHTHNGPNIKIFLACLISMKETIEMFKLRMIKWINFQDTIEKEHLESLLDLQMAMKHEKADKQNAMHDSKCCPKQ